MFRQRTLSSSEMADFEFADEFLPVYDVSDAVATVADADPGTAWRALVDVDLLKVGREAPVVGMLGALRMLPEIIGHLLHGEPPAKPPESMRLRDLPSLPMYEGGWILLGEREGHEIALGLVGKFWRPVIEWAPVTSADEFRDFDEPGFAKTVYDLSVREVGSNRTLLSGLMRTATTDEHARRWFRRYWTFGVGSGAHILVGALLDSARRAAEGDHERVTERAGKAAPSRPAVPLGRRRPHMPSARKRGASASRQGYLSRGQSRTRRATQVRPIPFKREQPSGHPPARRLLLHEGRTRVAG
jgi:hypothetical protein